MQGKIIVSVNVVLRLIVRVRCGRAQEVACGQAKSFFDDGVWRALNERGKGGEYL